MNKKAFLPANNNLLCRLTRKNIFLTNIHSIEQRINFSLSHVLG
jgi:hypothetical protein